MFNAKELEDSSISIWNLAKEHYFARRKEKKLAAEKRAERAQEMVDASVNLFQTRLDIEELTAIKVEPHNNRIKIDREFEQQLAERGVFFDGSEEWLLDFLKSLTGKSAWTNLSGWKGLRIHSDRTFDLKEKIPGLVMNRELLPDRNNPKFPAVYYTFVRTNE